MNAYVHINTYSFKSIKKGKAMEEEIQKKVENIFELFLTLHDSITYNWEEGREGYYQLALSKIIKDKFLDIFAGIDEDYAKSFK